MKCWPISSIGKMATSSTRHAQTAERTLIYLDSHATTRLAPEALAAMLPLYEEHFANPGSITHQAGREVSQIVQLAIQEIALGLGASEDELVITSGATEANNLALLGACLHPRQKRRKVLSFQTEHKAILDPLKRLESFGFQVQLLPVQDHASGIPGRVDVEQLAATVDEETALVSVMLANNEIGTIQPMKAIADICHAAGALLHTDAAQAVGRLCIAVDEIDVDLLSLSAHKFHGPVGVGALYVRKKDRRVRLQPQIVGGGQQANRRSGTLNAPGIAGMAAALRLCIQDLKETQQRVGQMRSQLFRKLQEGVDTIDLNGPPLDLLESSSGESVRLSGNLNCSFYPLEGQSLMMAAPDLAVSSGSACTSADPQPSHVLQAIGLSEEQARSSIRFGLSRYTTEEEIELAASQIVHACEQIKRLM